MNKLYSLSLTDCCLFELRNVNIMLIDCCMLHLPRTTAHWSHIVAYWLSQIIMAPSLKPPSDSDSDNLVQSVCWYIGGLIPISTLSNHLTYS